ncbi:MAG: hypothetical protein OXH96_01130 [Spirochaetaceae bacterium]|nr:hypothetical protein [Spirochaetaceae bacterium]
MAQVIQPANVRSRLWEALELDLVGPGAGQPLADERLPGWVRPSNWYLTGFLVPRGAPAEQRADADADDDFEPEVADEGGLGDDSTEDRRTAKKGFFPSSIGLSFLVAEGVDRLDVIVRWGDYRYAKDATRDDGRTGDVPDGGELSGSTEGAADRGVVKGEGTASTRWQRMAREEPVPVTLGSEGAPYQEPVPGSGGLVLHVVARPVSATTFAGRIPPGTRSVSLFLVNERPPAEDTARDKAFAFQVALEVRSAVPFVPRPDPRGASGDDSDERVADLHYAGTPEYAAGHGVAADWELVDGACRLLRTTWIPMAEVETTQTEKVPGVELAMAALGDLSDGGAAELALTPLVTRYRAWIEEQDATLARLTDERREAAEELVFHARSAANRMERGIRLLSRDADALDAFRVANRAVAAALSRRLAREGVTEPPRWRAFQLGFLLLNLAGLAEPANPEREFVDLLFFPTGGGKTEAYLGLAAFAMVLRRLRNPGDGGRGGAGVSVIMRYTLRLLTLDQLGRASGLVCALELERRKDTGRYGEWPFEIGLWVGKAGTPNRLGERGDSRSDSARSKVSQYKNNPQGKPAPIPLESCPWCGEDFTPDSFTLLPDADHPAELRIACASLECDFSGDTPLPIVAVDEPLYRRLPAFLVATVDKFASLPWVGESGALLGGADRHDESGFYGAAEPRRGNRSAIVGGLDTWGSETDLEPIDEPRLAAKLTSMTGVQEPRLYAPPPEPEHWQDRQRGIGAWRFPEWFVVQESIPGSPGQAGSRSRRMVRRTALDRGKFDKRPVVATRFVRACSRGDVDDIDWRRFVHGPDDPCRRQLRLDESGTSGDLAEQIVRCECGKSRRMLHFQTLIEQGLLHLLPSS